MNTFARIFFQIGIAALTSATVQAAEANGGFLLGACKLTEAYIASGKLKPPDEEKFAIAYCLGLVEGTQQTMRTIEELLPKNSEYKTCWPKEMSAYDSIKIVNAFLIANPRLMEKDRVWLIITALHSAYPCIQK